MLLSDILIRAEASHPDRIAVSAEGWSLSYRDILKRARKLAKALLDQGVSRGDRVGLIARNSFRYLEVNFACAFAGAILVPLNFRLAKAELNEILARTECRVVFRSNPFVIEASMPVIDWDDALAPGDDCAYEAFVAGATPVIPVSENCAPSDIAQIFFTSGTTGRPKGVCLMHANLVASAQDALETLAFSPQDVWLHAAPMFHLVDAFAIWGITLSGGRHVTTHFEPDAFGHLVQDQRITKTSLPPTLLDWIARTNPGERFDLGSLDLISYGGSPMQEAVYKRCRAALRCRLLQAYGLTEGSGFVCHEVPGDNPQPDQVINTVGHPTKRVRLKLQNANGERAQADEVGEVLIRGERVFQEYWRDAEATRDAFADGWYRTGDLAVMDDQKRYKIVGRKKEMIISGGENVYPAEVVNALLSHPAVAEAAVFGIPSERWGEEVQAVVFIAPDNIATPEELAHHCRNLIGGYKAPKRIAIWEQPLPKTGAGKIATAAIRETVAQGK
jgi:acyl-CoA synthetase (AMP-forming)/AMP-acid ligase II